MKFQNNSNNCWALNSFPAYRVYCAAPCAHYPVVIRRLCSTPPSLKTHTCGSHKEMHLYNWPISNLMDKPNDSVLPTQLPGSRFDHVVVGHIALPLTPY